MRIFIGNKEIAGYFTQLKNGFDKLGIHSDLWFLVGSNYYNPPMNKLALINQAVFRFYKHCRKSVLLPLLLPAAAILMIIHTIVFCFALIRYDVFILNSQPFFTYHELAILRFFRKKIIVVFLGTESRPAYLSGNNILGKYSRGDGKYKLERCFRDTQAQFKRIRRIERYAHYIINHPPTALFHSKPFISWLHIGFPNDQVQRKPEKFSSGFSRVVRILHAPSNSISKGTSVIETMIDKLQKEGLPIEYVRLENVLNERVIDELAKCDLVVDELYSDVPIGGLGTEAAFAQKAVLNGGNYSGFIHRDYPEKVIPPAIFCQPENLHYEIRNLVNNKALRLKKASELHQFVTSRWNNVQVAERYLQIIEGEIPEGWMYEPSKLSYFQGYGISRERLRSFLKSFVMHHGKAALCLDDKPELQQQLTSFIIS